MGKTNINEICFKLSGEISLLGVSMNSKRGAQVYYSMLTEACVEIGGGVRAINCLPARSMRIKQTEELIKLSTKVIFMLESGIRQEFFIAKRAKSALSWAIALSEALGVYVNRYCLHTVPATMPVRMHMPKSTAAYIAAQPVVHVVQPAVQPAYPVADPEGFSKEFKG